MARDPGIGEHDRPLYRLCERRRVRRRGGSSRAGFGSGSGGGGGVSGAFLIGFFVSAFGFGGSVGGAFIGGPGGRWLWRRLRWRCRRGFLCLCFRLRRLWRRWHWLFLRRWHWLWRRLPASGWEFRRGWRCLLGLVALAGLGGPAQSLSSPRNEAPPRCPECLSASCARPGASICPECLSARCPAGSG